MFITPDKSHVIVPWRQDLAHIIPHAREFEHQGERYLLFPNRSEEARITRNSGIPLPAPIITRYDWRGLVPWEVQKTTSAILSESPRAYVLNSFGCVDAETEYLAPDGWRRIAEYEAGAVAEYRPETGAIAFVEPSRFVKLPCDEMIRFKTTRGVDQLLSPEHRVLYADWKGALKVDRAENIYARYDTMSPASVRFVTTFRVEGTHGLSLIDTQIRLQVAVNADAYQMPYKTGKVSIRLKKERKIARLHQLLAAAGVAYVTGPSGEDFTAFRFVPPEPKNVFAHWWTATQQQLEVVADEAAHWDGSHRKADGLSFSSFAKEAADFIQYAFSASGRRTSLSGYTRERRGGVEQEWRVHAGGEPPLVQLVGSTGVVRRQNTWLEPSPDGFKYCFVVPSTFLLLRRNGCIFATGNTGKTRSAIWAADWLMQTTALRRVLIAAPLSTLTPVWETELFRVLPQARVAVLHGSRAKRIELLRGGAQWLVVNHHGLAVIADELASAGIDIFIIDELATFRNRKTGLWAAANTVVKSPSVRFAWGMTGSPTPQAPTDAWAQIKLLTPERTTNTMGRFKYMTMNKLSQFKWVARPGAVDIVAQAMSPSVRFTLEDVQELPATSYIDRKITLEPDLAKAYKYMFDKMVLHTNKGETITSMNEGILQNKLLQIACGYVYTDEKKTFELPNKSRVDALVQVVGENEHKVIVFVPYVHALQGIAAALKQAGESVEIVYGATSRSARDKIFKSFQEEPSPRVLVAHPATMSHGLSLTSATAIVWYAPVNSLETYEQANARIARPGQKHKTSIVHLIGTPVERATYARLKERSRLQGMLLELFHQLELDF